MMYISYPTRFFNTFLMMWFISQTIPGVKCATFPLKKEIHGAFHRYTKDIYKSSWLYFSGLSKHPTHDWNYYRKWFLSMLQSNGMHTLPPFLFLTRMRQFLSCSCRCEI